MRKRWLALIVIGVLLGTEVKAQAFLKTEYIGSSSFRDENNDKTGGSGDAKVVQGGINIPFAIRMNENDQPTAWGISLGGSYTKMSNKGLSDHIGLSEIFNLQVGLSHLRPLNDKLSIMGFAGIGLYMDTPSLSYASFDNILGSGGAIVIWHLFKNLELGGGLALNTTFGYPMVFPALYLNWTLEGQYKVNVSMLDAMAVTAGMTLTNYLDLNLAAEMNGSLALIKTDNKKKMFTHNYISVGLQPVIKLSGSWSIPITAGFTAVRSAYSEDRSLKAFFKGMSREYDPYFTPAFYCSAAIRYGF